MAVQKHPCRNVIVRGVRTSLRLEPEVFDALDEICARNRITLPVLCNRLLDGHGEDANLSSLLRVYTLSYFRTMAALPPLPVAQGEPMVRRRGRRQYLGDKNRSELPSDVSALP